MDLLLGQIYDSVVRAVGPVFGRTRDECESFLDGIGWYQETWPVTTRWFYVLAALGRFLVDKRDRLER